MVRSEQIFQILQKWSINYECELRLWQKSEDNPLNPS